MATDRRNRKDWGLELLSCFKGGVFEDKGDLLKKVEKGKNCFDFFSFDFFMLVEFYCGIEDEDWGALGPGNG